MISILLRWDGLGLVS